MRNVGEHISFMRQMEPRRPRRYLVVPGTYIRFVKVNILDSAPALLPVAIL